MFKWTGGVSDLAFNVLALLVIIGVATLLILWLPPMVYPPLPD